MIRPFQGRKDSCPAAPIRRLHLRLITLFPLGNQAYVLLTLYSPRWFQHRIEKNRLRAGPFAANFNAEVEAVYFLCCRFDGNFHRHHPGSKNVIAFLMDFARYSCLGDRTDRLEVSLMP